jgi:lysophospholipase L1-like esterase
MNKNKRIVFLISMLVAGILIMSFAVQKKQRILMIGDSTMSVKDEKAFPENGWGMALEKLLNENVELKNYARNGRSSKSFINEGLWDKVKQDMKEGDYIIIQFGHNDEKINDSSRYTTPQTTYKENLRKFISETKQKGGVPVLCTPVVRRKFKHGKLIDTHGDYPNAVRELAKEMNVLLVDMNVLTEQTLSDLGEEKSKKLFMILGKGEYPNFPDGKEDNTHLQQNGASVFASLFVDDVKKQNLLLAKLFK